MIAITTEWGIKLSRLLIINSEAKKVTNLISFFLKSCLLICRCTSFSSQKACDSVELKALLQALAEDRTDEDYVAMFKGASQVHVVRPL